MLADAAAKNGYELPLPIPSSPQETEIDHLHVDRALPDLLLRDEGPSAAHRTLRSIVWRAVRESRSEAERFLGVVGDSDTDARFGVHC
jgi:hypothetical protein